MYGAAIWIRNWCFDVKLFTIRNVSVPVISVGNMSTGGTGKTPFVELLVRMLSRRGKKVAVISRGYKRKSTGTVIVSDGTCILTSVEQSGDESYQIARKIPDAVIIVDEIRSRAATIAVEKFNVDVIVIDDGFQHRSLHRDLDIVMISGSVPLTSMHLLPAGLRREPLSSLSRAHLVAISSHLQGAMDTTELQQYTDAPIMKVSHKPKELISLDGTQRIDIITADKKNCIAFCGIGNPESFRRTLGQIGVHVKEFMTFSDHHEYNGRDLQAITQKIEFHNPDIIIMTEKDAVVWKSFLGGASPSLQRSVINLNSSFMQRAYYLEIEIDIVEGNDALQRQLNALFLKAA